LTKYRLLINRLSWQELSVMARRILEAREYLQSAKNERIPIHLRHSVDGMLGVELYEYSHEIAVHV
jgi:deoxyhypusine synthase